MITILSINLLGDGLRDALDPRLRNVISQWKGEIKTYDQEALEKGLTILPEMGMDPGDDLLLGSMALSGCLFTPRTPIYWIMRMLKEIRACLVNRPVRMFMMRKKPPSDI